LALLKPHVPADRFHELNEQADRILRGDSQSDLNLTTEETTLLNEAFALERAESGAVQTIGIAETTLTSSENVLLHFEVVVGDGGVLEGAGGPYDLAEGRFLDQSQWIEMD
jgi:hypothetical protein